MTTCYESVGEGRDLGEGGAGVGWLGGRVGGGGVVLLGPHVVVVEVVLAVTVVRVVPLQLKVYNYNILIQLTYFANCLP